MYENYRQLGFAVANQAVRDYFDCVDEGQQKTILKELRSDYMTLITDGMGEIIAEQLELYPEEIKKRFKRTEKELEEDD